MRVRVTGYFCAVMLLFAAAVTVQPAWATLPTPSQPILVVQDNTSTNPYQSFVPELLTTEGLNGFQVAQLSDLTSTFLSSYDVVILPHLTLTSGQATLFQNYVNAGGTLVGFRPDVQLASVFGVASLGTTLPEAWLKIDTTTVYSPSADSETMRFHGSADLYSLSSASAIATLYDSTTVSTTSPAVAINTFGLGKAILFSFDLSQSIVLMRQGNPAWAGYPNTHDGNNTMRPAQMFMDKPSLQFWNDLGDGALNDVPQADIQMRLFSNAVTLTNAAKRPLPKLWYFPNQNRSQLLMTGDDHSFTVVDAQTEISNIASFGGLFSYNLWYPFTTVTNAQVNTWLTAGNSMAIHFNDTAEMDSSGVGGSAGTWNGMQSVISTSLASFATTYPTAPFPVTTRNHFLMWISNDADGTPDQVANAKLFQNNGIQLDTSFSAFPNRWGYMTGSGLPMKFVDPVAGTLIPVYEQATQYEDDVQLDVLPYSVQWGIATAQTHYQQSLSDSLNKYNTVITMLFHPENWSNYQSYAQAALQYAQAQAIPISSTGSWLSFWKARAATTISMPSFTSNTLAFTATGSPAGLTLLVPFASGNNAAVSTFKVDGVSQSFTVAAYQGVTYASVVLTAGTHSISVGYTAAGRILGQVTPSAAAPTTTVQVQGTSFTQTVSVASNGTYVVGPLPAGNYTVTPASSTYAFTPSSRLVTVATADVTGINFTATVSTSGQTIFTTQTPVTTTGNDGPYELGTAFTSTAAGQITAVRFWKSASESGTHTGKIWSSTGTLLASVVFSGETASGWQQQALTTPISISANTAYVVSVNTGGAAYVATTGGLATQIANGNLRTVVGNNGVFGTAGSFPTNSFQTSNYFRDIVFFTGSTFTVSGAVSPATTGTGTTLTLSLSGTTIATTTAGSNGSYSFAGVNPGNYTVTPSKATFTFSPTSAAANVTNANVTVSTFTVSAAPTFTVSGSITPSASGAGASVNLTLSATIVATTTADSTGSYSFAGLGAGNYTVTPTKPGFTISPASAAANVTTANVTVPAFTATANPVTQTLFTTQTPATVNNTDAVNYELGTAFTSDITGQITAIRFWKTTSETGTHTGRIWSSTGTLLASVVFANETASGWQQQSLTTPLSIAASTTYVVSVNTGNTFYVATNGGLSAQVNNLDLHSIVGNNGVYGTSGAFPTNSFQGSNYFRDIVFVPGATFSVSGSVSPAASGTGTTLTLSSGATTIATTTANATGNFTFTGVNVGTYTVTPTKAGFTFSPTSAPASVSNANVTVTTFTATPIPTFTVSGAITPIASGTGATVSLTLGASPIASTTADSNGNYSFAGLVAGNYTVTPTKAGFTFSPTTAPANVTNANVTVTTFAATAVPTFTVSGAITPTASGTGSTVTLSLSGTTVATTTADATGSYTFSGVNAGNYTVTPAKSGFTFSPTTAPANVTTGNVTVATFTATAIPVNQTIFTTQTPASTNDSDGPAVNYELGTSFTSTASGQITAVRFWKGSSETGTHTGRIWSSTGTLLGSVAFVGETASGWQQQALTTPVSIAANTTYIVSVNTGNSFYVDTTSGLATQIVSGNLKSVVGSNGLYGTSGTFPTNSFQNSNYFRDVVFVPGATFNVSGSITPAASGNGATVALTLGATTVATTTADATGSYTFTGVLAGNYTVTPTKNGFGFSPTSTAANVTTANVTVATFTATALPTFTVSGAITPAASGTGATVTLTLGGTTVTTTTANAAGSYTFPSVVAGNYTVTPTKTGFTFSPTSAPANVTNANVTVATFTISAGSQTLFTTQTPATTNNTDGAGVNYELGMSFTSAAAGQITGVRFWKASSETGTHTGRIWSSTGTLLASVVFTGETASGWQQQSLTTPLAVTANTTYVVSVNTGNTFYVATNGGLATQVVNGNLKSVVGSNGSYGTTGTFPTNSFQTSNYFRDVVFVAGP